MTAALPVPARRVRRLPAAWRRPLAIIGVVVLAAWILIALTAPILAPADPLAQDFPRLAPPSAAHWFGTDELGRDVLSRTIYAARVSLPLAVILVGASMVIGAVIGAIAGFVGGIVDEVFMRIADLVFAFPTIILAMIVAA